MNVVVEVGDSVAKDQLIAELERDDYEIALREAQAALERARAAKRRADADYDRLRGLYANNSASKSELDAARAGAESSNADVGSLNERLALVRRQLSYTRLTAPMDGAVADLPIEEGENVAAGQSVALLTAGDQYEVEVAVPDALINAIDEGVRAIAKFSALPDQSFDATVVEVGVAATGGGSTFPVTVRA